jgi:hypothetical protein
MTSSLPLISVSVLNQTSICDISPSQISILISSFENEKFRLISCGDYVSAQQLENKIKELKLFQTKSTFNRIHQNRFTEIQFRLTEAQQKLTERLRLRSEHFKRFEEQQSQSLKSFNLFAEKELENFNFKHEIPPSEIFTKYSHEYLNLRMREKSLVSSKRYIEAECLKIEADKRMIIERENQEKFWIIHVNKQRELLISKQNDQRKAIERKWNRRWNELCFSINQEISKLENVVRKLKQKLCEIEIEIEGNENGNEKVEVEIEGTEIGIRNSNLKTSEKMNSVDQSKSFQRLKVSSHQSNRLKSKMVYVRSQTYNQTHRIRIRSHNSINIL